jgi:hypothetical protein
MKRAPAPSPHPHARCNSAVQWPLPAYSSRYASCSDKPAGSEHPLTQYLCQALVGLQLLLLQGSHRHLLLQLRAIREPLHLQPPLPHLAAFQQQCRICTLPCCSGCRQDSCFPIILLLPQLQLLSICRCFQITITICCCCCICCCCILICCFNSCMFQPGDGIHGSASCQPPPLILAGALLLSCRCWEWVRLGLEGQAHWLNLQHRRAKGASQSAVEECMLHRDSDC